MQPQSQQAGADTGAEQTPFYVKWGARGAAVVGGVLSMALALWVLFTLSAYCLLVGFLQMAVGFVVVALEAPFLCMFIDFAERIWHISERIAHWQKAILYCVLGLAPWSWKCFQLATFLGGLFIFVAGALYGYMALGKKADRATMMARAAAGGGGGQSGGRSTSTQNISQPADAHAWDANLQQQQQAKPYP